MTPAEAIASLDRQIAEHGQTVVLKRFTPPTELTVRAFVRGFKADDLPAGVTVGSRLCVISPTSLKGSIFETAPLQTGDKAVILGRQCDARPVENLVLDDQIVRVNIWVTG